jgi:hypothetical protein
MVIGREKLAQNARAQILGIKEDHIKNPHGRFLERM